MAWVAPPTFVSGAVLTAAQMNILSGDLNETAPGKATSAGHYFVSTAANTIAERFVNGSRTAANESTSSVSYTTLPTSVNQTLTTGTTAVAMVSVGNGSTTSSNNVYTSINVTGATTIAPSDDRSVTYAAANTTTTNRMGVTIFYTGLTAGSNTFTLNYRASAGSANWANRDLIVFPF